MHFNTLTICALCLELISLVSSKSASTITEHSGDGKHQQSLPRTKREKHKTKKNKGFILVDLGWYEWQWAQARTYCQDLGGDLYSINSAIKQGKVEAMATAQGITKIAWAGLTDDSGTQS